MTMDRLSARDYEEIRRRQAQMLLSNIEIRPAPQSRQVSNSQVWTDAQLERLRVQLLACSGRDRLHP
jgi:hypothetical protein